MLLPVLFSPSVQETCKLRLFCAICLFFLSKSASIGLRQDSALRILSSLNLGKIPGLKDAPHE